MSTMPVRSSRHISRTPRMLRVQQGGAQNQAYLKMFLFETQRQRLALELESLERRRATVLQTLGDLEAQVSALRAETASAATSLHEGATPAEAATAGPPPRVFRVGY